MTDNIAISVSGLGKCYRIAHAQRRPDTFAGAVRRAAGSPFKYLIDRFRAPDETELFWALKDVSFEVRQGEVLGIIGRNGAGKSTLLKILSRITDPTEGRAIIRGRVNSLLEVGTGFHPELTGRENIYMNAAMHGMKRAEISRKLDEIIAFAEIEKFMDTPVKRYSSGMYVRLAFAVAAHLEPEVMLVDEVLAVGDLAFQQKCIKKMGEISGAGRTVLLVSHNMASLANLCHYAVMLESGRFVRQGDVKTVIRHYIASSGSAQGEVVWNDPASAPGNDRVRFHAVRVMQKDITGPTSDVDISKEMTIQMAFWNFKDGAMLYSVIILYDAMGTLVFSSSNTVAISLTEDQWYGKPHPVGLFQSECVIPGNFLNEGIYFVTIAVGKMVAQTLILEEQVLSFNVHDTGEMRKSGFYGGWSGVIRPRLAWQTQYLGQPMAKEGV